MLLHELLRLLSHAAGATLAIFLCVLAWKQRPPGRSRTLLSGMLAAAALWHGARAAALFQIANVGLAPPWLDTLSRIAAALFPSLLLHLALLTAGRSERWAALGYLVSGAGLWASHSGYAQLLWLYAGAAAGFAAACAWKHARHAGQFGESRLLRILAVLAVAGIAVAFLFGADSAALALAALLPLAVLLGFVYRRHVFGLSVSRRIPFALTLGATFALYLFFVRRLAGFLEEEFEAFGALTEAVLILGAAWVWLPLYGWINRFLQKRARLFADFSKRLIEDAAHILDLPQRLDYLAGQVGRTFGLRRVLLAMAGEDGARGRFGEALGREELLAELQAYAAAAPDVVQRDRLADAHARRLLEAAGFNYLFPLRYEGRLTGVLLLDTTPRRFLDDETILLGLCRQISHSIETCRLVEEKINLERALARQEHLATLGKVAVTIAHEVKNPLSSVKTLVQLMREDTEVSSRYARDLDYIVGEVDRLNLTVQQLLTFSRPAPQQREDVDVSRLVCEIGDMLARAQAGAIRIERRVAPGLVCRAGAELIRQIVLNLALNALQVSPPGGRVTLEASSAEGRIRIAVEDEGPGVPADLREKIFEPFFTTKQRGTGLGLAIVRNNVRQLGGEIRLETPICNGKGTRFEVVLPAR